MRIKNIIKQLGIKSGIFRKLLIGIIVIIILISLIADIGRRNLNELERTYIEMISQVDKNTAFHDLKTSFQRIIMPANDYIIHGNIIEKSNFETQLIDLKLNIANYKKISVTKEVYDLLGTLETSLAEIETLSMEIFNSGYSTDLAKNSSKMEELDLVAFNCVESIQKYLAGESLFIEQNIRGNKLNRLRTNRTIIFITSLISFCLVIGGFFYVRQITIPLKKLEISAKKISQGDMSVNVEVKTNDEIENLAISFNHMVNMLEKSTVSSDYFRYILNRMIDTLIITDSAGNIRMVNTALLEKLGYREDEITGRNIGIILSKNGGNSVREDTFVKNIFDNDHIENIYCTYFTKTGDLIPVSFSSSLIYDKSRNISGLICLASCSNETDQAEKEEDVKRSNAILKDIRITSEIPLTKREMEILKLITSYQKSNAEIADELFISVRTVETHRRNIMQKLHTKNIISLVHYASQNGLI